MPEVSIVEYCRLLMNKPNVKAQLDAIECWYDAEQKRKREEEFASAYGGA